MNGWQISFTIVAGMALLLLSAPSSDAQTSDLKYRTFRPDAPSPHPAVVFLSGCDGLAPPVAPALYERRAESLRAQGQLVIFADYLGRRGLKTCAGSVTHEDAARDLVSAAAWLISDIGQPIIRRRGYSLVDRRQEGWREVRGGERHVEKEKRLPAARRPREMEGDNGE